MLEANVVVTELVRRSEQSSSADTSSGRTCQRLLGSAILRNRLLFLVVILTLLVVSLGGVFGLYSWRRSVCTLRLTAPEQAGLSNEYTNRCVTLEKVSTTAEQQLGLSGREYMPVDQGMLFVYKKADNLCFWMKDMRFNLDMLWLDDEQRVVKIEKDISPATYPEDFCSGVPARYVVEVNAGVAEAAQVQVGDRVDL